MTGLCDNEDKKIVVIYFNAIIIIVAVFNIKMIVNYCILQETIIVMHLALAISEFLK